MMSDLFSSLDANQIGSLSFLVWLTPMILSTVFIASDSWLMSPSKVGVSALAVNSESRQKSLLPLPLFLSSMMFFLVMMNLTGLTPFVYGTTSSLWVAGSLALSAWLAIILSGWFRSPAESAAHLAPTGAPAALMPFLVLIETVSIMIRPLTLTVRLIANISAGHIVMSLISNCLCSVGIMSMVPILIIDVGYTMFEVFVCFIQAYIFSLLTKLYAEEHP